MPVSACFLAACKLHAAPPSPSIVSIRTPELPESPHNTTSALSNLCLVSFYLRRIHPRICNYSGTSEVTRKSGRALCLRSPFMLMRTRRAHVLKTKDAIFEKKTRRFRSLFSSFFFFFISINIFETCQTLLLQRDGKYN